MFWTNCVDSGRYFKKLGLTVSRKPLKKNGAGERIRCERSEQAVALEVAPRARGLVELAAPALRLDAYLDIADVGGENRSRAPGRSRAPRGMDWSG